MRFLNVFTCKSCSKAGIMLHLKHGTRQATNQAHIQKDDGASLKLPERKSPMRSGCGYTVQKVEM